MKKILKRILFNLYLIRKTNWIKAFSKYDKQSDNILLVFASYPKNYFGWMFSGTFENDFALLNALLEQNTSFKVVVGGHKLQNVKDKKIYHNISNLYTFIPGNNYAESLQKFQVNLINKGNTLIPSEKESLYWENKIYMHKQFVDLNISHPKTIIVDKDHPAPKMPSIEFPLLFKPAHASGSLGIIKLNTQDEYIKAIEETSHKEYLIQEWVNMRKDLRLIYIGDELVVHYWRINQSADWKPTSTGHGSTVDFDYLPSQWMDFIFKEYKKLGIHTGAFDVTWQNDDLSTEPIILEVSPSYMPNPAPTGVYKNKSYSEFKKNILSRDAYYKVYIDLVFNLKIKLLKEYDRK